MATCVLTLYKNTKLENSKNDIIEDIEVYLNSLESFVVDSSFQYQRFELDKTIKVNMDQEYQTKSESLRKYNYCKLSTEVDGEPVNYYYFITKATQIAQKTIEFTLRMDTLNTYHFTRSQSDITNEEYKLSPKTTVTREHKDRLAVTGTAAKLVRHTADSTQASAIDGWLNEQGVLLPASYGTSLTFKFDWKGWRDYWRNLEPVPALVWPVVITPNDDMIDVYLDSIIIGSINHILGAPMSRIDIYPTKMVFVSINSEEYIYNFPQSSGNSPLRLSNMYFNVKFANPLQGQTGSSFAPSMNWDYVKYWFIDNYVYTTEYDAAYVRKIDEYSENVRVDLFKIYESNPLNTISISDNEKQTLDWYLVYKTDPNDTSSGAKVQLYSEQGYKVTTDPSDILITLTPQYEGIPDWYNAPEVVSSEKQTYQGEPTYLSGAWVEVGGNRYDAAIYYTTLYRQYNSSTVFSTVNILSRANGTVVASFSNVASVTFYNFKYLWVWSTAPGATHENSKYYFPLEYEPGSASTAECKPWNQQTLTDPSFIKAFAFPYPILNELNNYTTEEGSSPLINRPAGWSWNPTDKCLEIDKAQSGNFNYQLNLISDPFSVFSFTKTYNQRPGKGQLRDIQYESKLYHSDYYLPKFVYDNFTFPFNLELMDENEYTTGVLSKRLSLLPVTYIVSKNIQSKFAFVFNDYILKKSYQDFDNVLTVERNNEKALYTNAYLDYIKSGGYTYDQKKIKDQNITSGITSGITLATSIATLIGGIAATSSGYGAPMGIGAIIGGIAGIAGSSAGVVKNIINAQDQDAALAQKLQQLQQQSTNVSGNEDIDILQAICNNKPKLVRYEVSQRMKNAMWDLFHYCGYATNEQKVPHTDTRLYFNFIQADVVFDDYTFNDDIAEDIKNRWAQGVTFFHKVDGGYDIDQEYENFEVSIL